MSGKNKKSIAVDKAVRIDAADFLSGKNGIVWGTYDLKQSEIIQNALLAQEIYSEIMNSNFMEKPLFIIHVTNQTDVNPAIDFIWRNNRGLRLKPDWSYSAGEINKSFEYWLSGK